MAMKTNNWWVAIACSLIVGLNNGYSRVSGLLYIATLERFRITKSEASLPFFWYNVLKCLGGPLVGLLAEKFGSREVTTAGFVLSALGIGICYFAEDVTVLIILWGGIFGFGTSMSISMLGDILNDHFDENHIATASGISYGGASVASFINVYFCDFLLSHYGFSGTFLILSATILNGVPTGMVLIYIKARERLCSSKQIKENLNDRDCNIHCSELSSLSSTCNNQTLHFISEISSIRNNADCGKTLISDSEYEKPENHFTLSEKQLIDRNNTDNDCNNYGTESGSLFSTEEPNENIHKDHDQNTDNIESNVCFLEDITEISNSSGGTSNKNKENLAKLKDEPVKKLLNQKSLNQMPYSIPPIDKTLLRKDNYEKQADNFTLSEKHTNVSNNSSKLLYTPVLRNIMLCIRIFWNPTFLVICILQSSIMFLVNVLMTVVIDTAKDKDIASGLQIYSLSCFQIADTIGRFGLGWVTDCNLLSNVNFNAISFACIGISSGAIALSSNFVELIVAVSMFGILSGAAVTLFTGTMCEFIEKDQLKMAMSARFVLSVPMFLVAGPLIRIFRENMGSYDGIFYVIAILSFICSILSLLIPSIAKCRMRNRRFADSS